MRRQLNNELRIKYIIGSFIASSITDGAWEYSLTSPCHTGTASSGRREVKESYISIRSSFSLTDEICSRLGRTVDEKA